MVSSGDSNNSPSQEPQLELPRKQNPEAWWPLWQLSLVLREIALGNDQAQEAKDIEKEVPPSQATTEDVLTGGSKQEDPDGTR